MPKLKCPRCGSLKTVPIPYKEPSYGMHEAERSEEAVLLGCLIEPGAPPTRACLGCKHQFRSGRLASLLQSDDFIHFEFSIGGYFGISHRMLIQSEKSGCLLKYGRNTPYPVFDELKKEDFEESPGTAYFEKPLSKSEWLRLAQKLDRCEIIEWKRKFYDKNIIDGTQWSIEIKIKGIRKIAICGSNAYPPTWNNFMNLLRREVDPSIS